MNRPEELPAQKFREQSKRVLAGWLDLQALAEENRRLRALLYEQLTRPPVLPTLTSKIQSSLKEERQALVFYINVIEGAQTEKIEPLLKSTQKRLLIANLTTEVVKSGSSFIILAVPEEAINKNQADELKKSFETDFRKISCFVGHSLLEDKPNVRLERLVEETLEKAMAEASPEEESRLKVVLSQSEVRSLFVPLASLTSGEVVAYEALSRSERGDFVSPDKVARYAIEADLLTRLDHLYKNQAKRVNPLFINIDPKVAGEPEFRKVIRSLLSFPYLPPPSRLVFAMSEETVTESFDYFKLTFDYLKTSGYRISIDQAKSPTNLLEIVSELKPQFVAIDRHLTQNIDRDEAKQELVKSILNFASRGGAYTIADGIETEEEAEILKVLGIRFGQGPALRR